MRPLSFRESSKRPNLRERRRRLRGLMALFVLVLIGGVVYAVHWASYLPQFSVQEINVVGTNATQPEQVHAFVGNKLANASLSLLSPRNIFLYPRGAIESAIKNSFPRIEKVAISRESLLATAITVAIEERKAFARWCHDTTHMDEECFAMDTRGFIFAAATTSANGSAPYVFEGALSHSTNSGQVASTTAIGQTYLPGRFAGVLALLERLGQTGFSPQTISTDGGQDFSIALAQGFEIRASFGADIVALVKNLELVLSSEGLRGREDQLEYIDLRFGNRVYFKLKGEKEISTE